MAPVKAGSRCSSSERTGGRRWSSRLPGTALFYTVLVKLILVERTRRRRCTVVFLSSWAYLFPRSRLTARRPVSLHARDSRSASRADGRRLPSRRFPADTAVPRRARCRAVFAFRRWPRRRRRAVSVLPSASACRVSRESAETTALHAPSLVPLVRSHRRTVTLAWTREQVASARGFSQLRAKDCCARFLVYPDCLVCVQVAIANFSTVTQ